MAWKRNPWKRPTDTMTHARRVAGWEFRKLKQRVNAVTPRWDRLAVMTECEPLSWTSCDPEGGLVSCVSGSRTLGQKGLVSLLVSSSMPTFGESDMVNVRRVDIDLSACLDTGSIATCLSIPNDAATRIWEQASRSYIVRAGITRMTAEQYYGATTLKDGTYDMFGPSSAGTSNLTESPWMWIGQSISYPRSIGVSPTGEQAGSTMIGQQEGQMARLRARWSSKMPVKVNIAEGEGLYLYVQCKSWFTPYLLPFYLNAWGTMSYASS